MNVETGRFMIKVYKNKAEINGEEYTNVETRFCMGRSNALKIAKELSGLGEVRLFRNVRDRYVEVQNDN